MTNYFSIIYGAAIKDNHDIETFINNGNFLQSLNLTNEKEFTIFTDFEKFKTLDPETKYRFWSFIYHIYLLLADDRFLLLLLKIQLNQSQNDDHYLDPQIYKAHVRFILHFFKSLKSSQILSTNYSILPDIISPSKKQCRFI